MKRQLTSLGKVQEIIPKFLNRKVTNSDFKSFPKISLPNKNSGLRVYKTMSGRRKMSVSTYGELSRMISIAFSKSRQHSVSGNSTPRQLHLFLLSVGLYMIHEGTITKNLGNSRAPKSNIRVLLNRVSKSSSKNWKILHNLRTNYSSLFEDGLLDKLSEANSLFIIIVPEMRKALNTFELGKTAKDEVLKLKKLYGTGTLELMTALEEDLRNGGFSISVNAAKKLWDLSRKVK